MQPAVIEEFVDIETIGGTDFLTAQPLAGIIKPEGNGVEGFPRLRGLECQLEMAFADDAAAGDNEMTIEQRLGEPLPPRTGAFQKFGGSKIDFNSSQDNRL